ncbi:hypothetical protein ACHAXH_007226 [Discostella pseudostelligera]
MSMSSSSRSNNRSGGDNSNSYDNLPTQDEIAQQKSEAYKALSSFHETTASLPRMTTTSSSQKKIQSLLSGLDDDDEKQIQRPEYWMCQNGAITYSVPMDPAAGLKRGTISKPYRCSVRLEMDLDSDGGGGMRRRKRGLRLVESIQHVIGEGGGGGGGGIGEVPFLRSIPLGENVDVDAVDGSYSFDVALSTDTRNPSPMVPLLPPSLLGNNVGRGASDDPMSVKFLVEHTIAVSETERCRCFLLYGDASNNGRGGGSVGDDLTVPDEDMDEDDYAIVAAKRALSGKKDKSESGETEKSYRLLSVILAEETKVLPAGQQSSELNSQLIGSSNSSEAASASSSPLNLLELNQSTGDGQMDQLIQSLQKHNDRVMNSIAASTGGGTMERFSLGMFGLTSGVWLGDTFIRENIPLSLQRARESRSGRNKGFDLKNKQSDSGSGIDEDRFATWSLGVQKVALRFEWDYSDSISQSYTYGKVIGTATSLSSMANIKTDGIIVVNESRPTKKREERRVIFDMDGGAYVSGLLGSYYFRAPRYMSFSQSRSYSADAYLTEFMVFFRPALDASSSASDSGSNNIGVKDSGVPEYYCSRSCRLYNANNGGLQQGSTAFFSLKRVGSD